MNIVPDTSLDSTLDEFQNFHLLSRRERASLSQVESEQYFKKIKQYYLNQPFDEKRSKKQSKNNLLLRAFLFPVSFLLNQQIVGTENFPQDNGFIIVSNHLHPLDSLMILSKIRGIPYRLLIKQEVSQGKLGSLFSWSGSIFVDRKSADSRREAKDELVKTVLHGGNVLIFPEGTINYSREQPLLDFKFGAVSVAQITGAPIIPIAITDQYEFMSKNLFVTVGMAIHVSIHEDLATANDRLKSAVKELVIKNGIIHRKGAGV